MNRKLRKTIIRDIRGSLGRYLAILMITALGVGFFAGLRITNAAMRHTMDGFLSAHDFYDLRIILPQGVSDADVADARTVPGVRAAEGSISMDAVWRGEDEEEDQFVLKTHLLPESVNRVRLKDGRLPEKKNECVLDHRMGALRTGDKIFLTDDNSPEVSGSLACTEYTIVGLVDSPLYINFERGSTSAGNGTVSGFVYLTRDGFTDRPYSEMYLRLDTDAAIYSDAYNSYIDEQTAVWESRLQEKYPAYYILDRGTNIGYACFESDSEIVGQVAKVFPLFFIMVAILVIMTTMGRFVEERRTEIGTLKALGYSAGAISAKFMIYAGSAAVIGCLLGYWSGIHLFPGVIWITYRIMYISIPMKFVWDWPLFAVSLSAALFCSLLATRVAADVSMRESAAQLMRPKAPKAGKRVFLEKLPFIWKRLSFLRKVSVRNIFRYKGRLFMMVLGVSGCTALLVTGMGLKDSIAGFADTQFGEIEVSDASLVFREVKPAVLEENSTSNPESSADDSAQEETLTKEDLNFPEIPPSLRQKLDEENISYLPYYEAVWTLLTDDRTKEIRLIAPSDYEKLRDYVHLFDESGKDLEAPEEGEALISVSLAKRYHLSKGDTFTLRNEDMQEKDLVVSGIFENHVYDYVYINRGEESWNSLYLSFPEGSDPDAVRAEISSLPEVVSFSLNDEIRTRVGKMMKSLNYVVLLVIFFAAALAFVVIYNLTNINITERNREIATIKVLGFYPGETSRYVFRENLLLTLMGTAVGLLLGIPLHRFVMSNIVVDMVYFSVVVRHVSFLLAAVFTILFNMLVSICMRGRLEKIDMAESLKSVE